nr:putative disease resistance rpp13-like protein 1 [Quercus suber]
MAWALVSTTVGQLGSLIASEFAGRLGSLFASDVASIVNVKEEVEKLERKFHEIQAKLNDAEERQVKEKAVKLWVRGRKLFLVLDDVWTEDSMLWEPFRLALQNAAQGSRILVTTRKSEVADVMGSAKRINLEELSNDDCWSIFSTIAFSDRDSEQHEKLLTVTRVDTAVQAKSDSGGVGILNRRSDGGGAPSYPPSRRSTKPHRSAESGPSERRFHFESNKVFISTTPFRDQIRSDLSFVVRFSANVTKEGQERTGPRFRIDHIAVQRDGQEVIRRDDEEELD